MFFSGYISTTINDVIHKLKLSKFYMLLNIYQSIFLSYYIFFFLLPRRILLRSLLNNPRTINTCFLRIPINGPKSIFSVLKFVFCILQYYKTTRFRKFGSIYMYIHILPHVLKPQSHALPHILFTYL